MGVALATPLATIGWRPAGELERRLEPVRRSSLATSGPVLVRSASVPVRTLPGGAVCITDAAGCFVRVDPSGGSRATTVQPHGDLIDFLGLDDGTWVLLERVPDEVRARRIADDGSALWTSGAGLGGLLRDAGAALFGVTDRPPRRLVALDADTGAAEDAQPLEGAEGRCFMNGAGLVGFTVDGSWATVDARTGERSEIRLEEGSGMDYPIGLDADGRSYWNRFATLRRLTRDGRLDWDLEAGQAIVMGDRVWVQQRPPAGDELVAQALDADAPAIALPTPPNEGRAWRLAGRDPDGSFVVHGTLGADDAGMLARIGSDGSLREVGPASDSVWLEWFDMQRPSAAAVTDTGELDIAVRGPDGLHVIRITP